MNNIDVHNPPPPLLLHLYIHREYEKYYLSVDIWVVH